MKEIKRLQPLSFRVSLELNRMLEEYCEKYQLSKSAAVSMLLIKQLEKEREEIGERQRH